MESDLRTVAIPRSLAEQAAERIRRLIVGGKLQPGQALSETALAAELGVSKTPIREALLRLQTEGLVQILPQKGTFVFQLSVVDAHALSEFRSVLEITALRLAMRRDAAALAAALRTVVDKMKPAKSTSESLNYLALDDLFHRCIIEHCDNAYLSDSYESVALLVQTLRNRLADDTQLNARSLKDHRELVRLIERGQVEQAATHLKKHIANTAADYAKRLAPSSDALGTSNIANFSR
jgi:DNA-binding GntR family transcriptional regulator